MSSRGAEDEGFEGSTVLSRRPAASSNDVASATLPGSDWGAISFEFIEPATTAAESTEGKILRPRSRDGTRTRYGDLP